MCAGRSLNGRITLPAELIVPPHPPGCTVIGTPQTLMTCPIPAGTEVGDKIDIALTVKVGPDADLSTIFTADAQATL
jgi:hypothetical protein